MGIGKLFQKKSGLSTATIDELQQEILRREVDMMEFPLYVFNSALHPFIKELEKSYNIPRSFIGISLLTAYSSAIGNSFMVTTNGQDKFPLTFYSGIVGMTSSAKSLVLKKTFSEHFKIQEEFDEAWTEETKDMKYTEIESKQMKTIVYRDSHLATLMRSVLPDNPKGVSRILEELIEWINSMNALAKKEGIDEQVWLSIWDGASYSGIRSGKQKFSIKKPFVNVVGGIQYAKLKELFKNDRGFSGFISRILFAVPERDAIPLIDPDYSMPEQFQEVHEKLCRSLYSIAYDSYQEEPRLIQSNREANKLYHEWVKKNTIRINGINEFEQRELEASIFGKMKNYTLRIAAVLSICDRHFEYNGLDFAFRDKETINDQHMKYAIDCSEYFTKAAIFVALYAKKESIAPPEVLQLAALVRSGKSYMEIGRILYGQESGANKSRAMREIKKQSSAYPKTFNAQAR